MASIAAEKKDKKEKKETKEKKEKKERKEKKEKRKQEVHENQEELEKPSAADSGERRQRRISSTLTEKAKLVDNIISLQTTLLDICKRVDAVEQENKSLEEENEVLKIYVDNLMAKMGAIHTIGTSPKNKLEPRDQQRE